MRILVLLRNWWWMVGLVSRVYKITGAPTNWPQKRTSNRCCILKPIPAVYAGRQEISAEQTVSRTREAEG
jgi:hypothetical protein